MLLEIATPTTKTNCINGYNDHNLFDQSLFSMYILAGEEVVQSERLT